MKAGSNQTSEADIIEKVLKDNHINYEIVLAEQIAAMIATWEQAFDPAGKIPDSAKRKGSKRVHFWDHFSERTSDRCTVGAQAFELYQKQWAAEYAVFGQWGSFAYRCKGPYIDLRSYAMDVYVAHHNVKWTIIFTHEVNWDSHLGPFFCIRQKDQ